MKRLRNRKIKDVALLIDSTGGGQIPFQKVLSAAAALGEVRERKVYVDTADTNDFAIKSRNCGLEVVTVSASVTNKRPASHILMTICISELLARKTPPSNIVIVTHLEKAFHFLPPMMPKTQLWICSQNTANTSLTTRGISQLNYSTGEVVPSIIPSLAAA
eukprot:TRINITY_DN24813_c0_g1_i1.p1 TRINITY_DN24813_c0_g1~~TRINITY_DN24813_c0_g1_i1.p1  ORF type:complete len:161 (+),score=17.13 TRINITY_DN24813_c0_g1_i1:57-539(+)